MYVYIYNYIIIHIIMYSDCSEYVGCSYTLELGYCTLHFWCLPGPLASTWVEPVVEHQGNLL